MKLIDINRDLFDYLVAFRLKTAKASAPSLDVVQHEIESIFYGMEQKISNNPKLQNEYQQVKYPLVVLADEVILTSAWSHAKRWEQCLLEKRYFQSNIGGNRFFKLLANVEQMPQGVLTVFYCCLAFGFRGAFPPNDPSLMRLKGRLLQRILPQKTEGDNTILPQAYRVDTHGSGRLPKVWKWRHIAIMSVLLFLVLLSVERMVIWPLIMGQTLETALNANPAASTEPSTTADETAVPGSETSMDFTAQLGIFSSETLAKHFSQQLQPQGINARIYYTDGGANGTARFLVVSGSFGTSEEAMQLIAKAQSASNIVSEMSVLRSDQVQGDCIHGCD